MYYKHKGIKSLIFLDFCDILDKDYCYIFIKGEFMKVEIKRFLFYTFFSIFIGIIIGMLTSVFSIGLSYVSVIRDKNFERLVFFLPLVGVGIIFFYEKYGKNTMKGMKFVFEAYRESTKVIPIRLIPFSMISTWLTHLFGGSAGREGVAVQIGATLANNVINQCEKYFKVELKSMKKVVLRSGISAGFAGLFGAPLAGTFFALELLKVGIMNYRAFYPIILSAYSAYFTSKLFKIKHFHFLVVNVPPKNIKVIVLFILVSLIFTGVGSLFAFCLKKLKNSKILLTFSKKKRIFYFGILLMFFLIFFHNGRYSGLGTNLIHGSFYGERIYLYDWLLKLLLTVFTLGIGFQGGEVTPLFSIGASLGVVLGLVFPFSMTFLAAIGYCAVFSAATNTFLACFFIGVEVFGYGIAEYLLIACAISYLFSGKISIYSAQKRIRKF